MKRFAAALLWTALFLILFAGADQFFVRVPTTVPVLAEARSFYLDFRGRLLGLAGRKPADTLEAVIEKSSEPTVRSPHPGERSPRFLYADSKGELRFADSLEEIPPKYRKRAQPLEN